MGVLSVLRQEAIPVNADNADKASMVQVQKQQVQKRILD